jgi:hypothetical protein
LEAQRRELDDWYQSQLADHIQRGATLRLENEMLRRRLAENSPRHGGEGEAVVAVAGGHDATAPPTTTATLTQTQTVAAPMQTAAAVTAVETVPTADENSAAPTLTADANALRAQAAAAEAARDAALAVQKF